MPQDESEFARIFSSPIGDLLCICTSKGVRGLSFIDNGILPTNIVASSDILDQAELEISEYFEGKRRHFSVPLDLRGTPFMLKVWETLMQIPFGKTITYTSQSKILGDAKAIRAVAAANGKNPVVIIVPCHRVVGASGNLTGYIGGLDRKRYLIDHESGYKNLFEN